MLNVTTDDRESWNNFIFQNKGIFLQSWEWGEFQEVVGNNVYRYEIQGDSDGVITEPVAKFLLIEHHLPMGMKYAYIPMGPTVIRKNDEIEVIKAVIVTLRQSAKQLGNVFVRIEPPVSDGLFSKKKFLLDSGFVSTSDVQPQNSIEMDLNKTEAELLAEMKQKTRYNIKLAQKKGVVIREANRTNAHNFANDFNAFWQLMLETTTRDGFASHNRNYYEKMLEVLSPLKNNDLKVRLLLAEHEGDLLATAIVAEFKNTVTYLHGASTSHKRAVMAPYLLHWDIICSAKANGFKKYDFWGVAPEEANESHSWYGITRFKAGFGGKRINYCGAWDLPIKKLPYNTYRLVKNLKRKLP